MKLQWPIARTPQGKADDPTNSPGWQWLWGFLKSKGWTDSNKILKDLDMPAAEKAFQFNPVIFACVTRIMNSIADCRLEIGTQIGPEWKPLPTHPLLELLDKPNPYYSGEDLLRYFVSRLLLTGKSHIWIFQAASAGAGGRVGGQVPAELWPLPTSWVTEIPPESGGSPSLYSGFKVLSNNKIVAPEDMVLARLTDPATTGGAVSPLQACSADYQIDAERENYLAEMLVNMKVPGMILRPERRMGEANREELRQTIMEKFGSGNRGKPLVIEGKGEVDMPNPMQDLDWPGVTSLSETRICAAFGTPPILVHIRAGLDRSTYSNYGQARRSFYQETLAPMWTAIAGSLSRTLLLGEDPRLKFRFAYDEKPEFQEDEKEKTERVGKLFKLGLYTRAKALTVLGEDPNEAINKPEPLLEAKPPGEKKEEEGEEGEGKGPVPVPTPPKKDKKKKEEQA